MRRQTKNSMKNSLEIDYLDLNLKILELEGLQEEFRAALGNIYQMEGEGPAREAVTELKKTSEEIIKILDQYLINESIQTLKKIKEGFQQSEENSILQMALTFEL